MDSNSAQNIFKYTAVVPAAGLSSRMGAFKPLLDLGGKPLICRTLDSLRNAGCGKIFVVTGHRADELEAAAAAPDVRFVRNPDYASTGMLESVQLGLNACLSENLDLSVRKDSVSLVFILPGDIPLIRTETMRRLAEVAQKQLLALPFVLRPSYRGRAGHPVVLDRSAAQMLLSYKGLDGIRGFLRQLEADAAASFVRVIETDDPRILTDVDTPEDYLKWNK